MSIENIFSCSSVTDSKLSSIYPWQKIRTEPIWHSNTVYSLFWSLTRYLVRLVVTSKASMNSIPCLKNPKSSNPQEILRAAFPLAVCSRKSSPTCCVISCHLAKFLCLSFSPTLRGTTIKLHAEDCSASQPDPVIFSTAPLLVCIINMDFETLSNKFCNWKIFHVQIRKQPSATFFVHYGGLF